jgi:hypothetical protein
VSGDRASATGLREQLAGAWAAGSQGRRAAILVGGTITAALAGAFLFGAWHILFGGFVKGNWRAGAFGIALAGVSGGLLAIEAGLARHRMR